VTHLPLFFFVLALACVVAFSGCRDAGEKKRSSQVAAKVNSDEITVHQINRMLARSPSSTPEVDAGAKRTMLDRLIDLQLAKQQATDKKLDRTPEVVQALEAARTEILARAYLQQITATKARPTPEQVKEYYNEHPELFAQRRLYVLEEIGVGRSAVTASALRERVAKARSMQEIADWLRVRNIQFTFYHGGRNAEQIPLGMLPRLNTMKDGEIEVFESSRDNYAVIRIISSKTAPVAQDTAAGPIQQFLSNQQSREVIADELKRLKQQAALEYVGEFASATPPAVTKSGAGSAPHSIQPQTVDMGKGVRGLR
jgi:EpsD family peptidyl-prolyl cis-trans isomerase